MQPFLFNSGFFGMIDQILVQGDQIYSNALELGQISSGRNLPALVSLDVDTVPKNWSKPVLCLWHVMQLQLTQSEAKNQLPCGANTDPSMVGGGSDNHPFWWDLNDNAVPSMTNDKGL